MSFAFDPTLKHLTLLDLCKTLIKENEAAILTYFKNVNKDYIDEYDFITAIIYPKIKEQPLPNEVKSQLVDAVRNLEAEINDWISTNNDILWDCGFESFIKNLRWTSAGKIDEFKTMDNILMDESVEVKNRLFFSCRYCRKECFENTWNKCSTKDKEMFLNSDNSNSDGSWITSVCDYFSGAKTLAIFSDNQAGCQEFFHESVQRPFNLASLFFWGMLTPENQSNSLASIEVVGKCNFDFLYAHMVDPMGRKEFFLNYNFIYCQRLIANWMWHNHCVKELASFPPQHLAFNNLYPAIIEGMRCYPTSTKLVTMFSQCWLYYSEHLLSSATRDDRTGALFTFLQTPDRRSFVTILRDLNSEMKQDLLNFPRIICTLLLKDRFEMVNYLLKDILKTSESIAAWKHRIVSFTEEMEFEYELLFLDDEFETLRKFLTWTAPLEEDLRQIFKRYIFFERHGSFFPDLLYNRYLFLDCWDYFNLSPEEMAEFRALFDTETLNVVCDEVIYDKENIDWNGLDSVLTPLFLTKEALRVFKEAYVVSRKQKIFQMVMDTDYKLLDEISDFFLTNRQQALLYKISFYSEMITYAESVEVLNTTKKIVEQLSAALRNDQQLEELYSRLAYASNNHNSK